MRIILILISLGALTACRTTPTPQFQNSQVAFELPPELVSKQEMPTHRMSGLQDSQQGHQQNGTPQTINKAAKTKDGMIFQGAWLGDVPHGPGTCYQQTSEGMDKLSCVYFQGIVVQIDNNERRNSAMYECMKLVGKQMQEQQAQLTAGSAAYKQQQGRYLLSCYQTVDQFLLEQTSR